jgi:hypothetical protein
MRRHDSFLVAALAAVAGCSASTNSPSLDASSDPEAEEIGCETQTCTGVDECDDGVECTRDTCVIGGCCLFEPDDDECPPGQMCDPDLGCIEVECLSDEDCDDGLDCTDDTCLVDHTCDVSDACPAGHHCEAEGCVPDEECATNADCQDGDFCNGEERCDPEFGCLPPEGPRVCEDTDPCTVDECDETANMCTFTCDPTIPGCEEECPVDPYSGCFHLSDTVSQTCALGHVSYSFGQICFEKVGLTLQVTAGGIDLVQTPAPTGMVFTVEKTVGGACEEYYAISGEFLDSDSFTGTWTATFTPTTPGGCLGGGCANQSIPLSGTRI